MAITQLRTWEQVLSTTSDNYAPRLFDNVSRNIALLFELKASGNIVEQPGGNQIVIPLLTGLNSTAKFYTDGDTLDVSYQTGIEAAQYQWKQMACSTVMNGGAMLKNQAPYQMINLIIGKLEQTERSAWDLIDNSTVGLFSNNGDALTGLSGLQSLVSTTPTAGTVGNIPRATNSFWQNQVGTAISAFATNGISRTRSLYYSCVRGLDHPNLLVSDSASYQNYLAALTTSIQFRLPFEPGVTSKRLGDAGFQSMQFEGAGWVFDTYCPTGYIYVLNTNVLQLVAMAGRNFVNTDWISRADQDNITARLLFMGELVAKDMQRLGVITGANA